MRKSAQSGIGTASGIIAVLVIVLVIAGLIYWYRSTSTTLGETTTIIAVCKETGKVFELEIETGSEPPYPSPASESETAYRALQCQNCGAIYAMMNTLLNENECPNCHQRVPMLLPYIPGQHPDEDESEEPTEGD
jgi:hypothetical protein